MAGCRMADLSRSRWGLQLRIVAIYQRVTVMDAYNALMNPLVARFLPVV